MSKPWYERQEAVKEREKVLRNDRDLNSPPTEEEYHELLPLESSRLQRLGGNECAIFFEEHRHLLNTEDGVNLVIDLWLNTQPTVLALAAGIVTASEIRQLKIPRLPELLVGKIKAAYLENLF
jgi:hypothetical protein